MAARIGFCLALLISMVASVLGTSGSALAQADLDAGTYTDPVFSFAFSWDPDLYEATELVGDDDVPYGVHLENDLEYGSMSAGGYASPRRCLTERSNLFEEIEGVSDMEEADDLDWPETDPDAHAALYRYVYENPDTGDSDDFVQYFECRDLLIDGEPVDDVVLTFDMGIEEASYEDVIGAWEDILDSIEWDAEDGSDNGTNNGTNGDLEPGLNDNTYLDANDGWAVTWDEDVLSAEEWILHDDVGVEGVQLFAESGSFLTIFTEEAQSLRSCVPKQLEAFEDSLFSGFEENDEVDLPETADDARGTVYQGVFTTEGGAELDIYFYAECRPLIIGGEEDEERFLVVNLMTPTEVWEDELPIWSEVLTAIEFDAAGNGRDEPTPDDNGRDEPTPDNGGGETGIAGDTYTSALGYTVSWNDELFAAEYFDEENPDRGIVITSEGSYITIQVAGDPDAAACVEAEVSVLEGLDGMSRLSESDLEGPEAPRSAENGLFDATLTASNGNETDVTVYVECRLLAETDDTPFFIVVSMISFGDAYEDELPEWQAILDSIEIG